LGPRMITQHRDWVGVPPFEAGVLRPVVTG
jgi:hypothetical protein